jgi:hypothetical protein
LTVTMAFLNKSVISVMYTNSKSQACHFGFHCASFMLYSRMG